MFNSLLSVSSISLTGEKDGASAWSRFFLAWMGSWEAKGYKIVAVYTTKKVCTAEAAKKILEDDQEICDQVEVLDAIISPMWYTCFFNVLFAWNYLI